MVEITLKLKKLYIFTVYKEVCNIAMIIQATKP